MYASYNVAGYMFHYRIFFTVAVALFSCGMATKWYF